MGATPLSLPNQPETDAVFVWWIREDISTEKIDFVMISPRLADAVDAALILALQDGYLSDHRALVVDFNSNKLFGSTTLAAISPSKRCLNSTNPRALHAYMSHMSVHLDMHHIVEKATELAAISVDD